MAVQRENILGLIGSRRYHSAILTTFSFDFYFFEMKAMRWLRSCGVRNVNVLIDGHYYTGLMQQLGGEEMNLAPAYSLYPVFGASIFHPKIWMLFGEKEGLIIVGSGNLTNSGNGNNEEVWGAFHFDINSSENALLFSSAWDYIQKLCAPLKGYTHEKTNQWLFGNSKWLTELPKSNGSIFHEVSGNHRVAFLYNSVNDTIFQKLSNLLGKESVIEITTLSPYYDKGGKAIQALSDLWSESKVNVVIDESGTIPWEIPLSKQLRFFNWYELGISKAIFSKSEEHSELSKLHAKIIFFKVDSGKEFLMIGSANVTPEGLGLTGIKANEEVSLLIESLDGGLLKNLGIKLKSPVDLSEFNVKRPNTVLDVIISRNRKKINLLAAEVLLDEVFLHAVGDYSSPVVAKIFDSENKVLHSIDLESFSTEIRLKLNIAKGANHIEMYDESGNSSLSNKVLLSDQILLSKTYPNPKTEKIERIFQDIQGGDLIKVLDLLQYALLDEPEGSGTANNYSLKGSNETIIPKKNDREKLYELSNYKTIEKHSHERRFLFFSNSLRVLDAIKFVSTADFLHTSQIDLDVDEQLGNLDETEGKEENEVVIQEFKELKTLKTERRKLLAYLNKINKHQEFLLYSKDNPNDYKPTLIDLSKYLIAIELLHEFGGKIEKYTEDEKDGLFTFLEFTGDRPYHLDNVKGCILNIIGKFLLTVKSGFETYSIEYTQKKMQQLKSDALVGSLVCILNTKWKESERCYAKCLILNCLHFLGIHDLDGLDLPTIQSRVEKRIKALKNRSIMLTDNYRWLKDEVIPLFKKAIEKLTVENFESEVKNGQFIYKSPWGYCLVKDVSNKNELTLVRPGFLWDNKMQDFVRHRNDAEYIPLTLHSFVVLDE